MRSSVLILLLPPESTAAAPTIVSVRRTTATTAEVIVFGTTWTRIIIYYPDTNGSVVWDSDVDPTFVVNVDSNTVITLDLPAGIQASQTVPLEATDTLGVASDPTPFDVPALRRGGGMMGGGALVGFGGL
jgi:hypothetical protein